MAKATSKVSTVAYSRERALAAVPQREAGAHKWGVGGLIIIGGAPNFIGAPALAAMGAIRIGAGVVNVAAPRMIIGAVASIVPEASFLPLPDIDISNAKQVRETIAEKLEQSKAMVVGPGIGQDDVSKALMSELLGIASTRSVRAFGFDVPSRPNAVATAANGLASIFTAEKPTVVDADALNWLATQTDWQAMVPANSLVLTPHAGEMARLCGVEIDEVVANPVEIAAAAAQKWQQVVVLKVGPTIVTNGTETILAESTSPALASAGTGDVLAGIIGGLLAQGVGPLEAAALAVYLGTDAVERIVKRVGIHGLIASDLPLAYAETLAALVAGENANA